VKHRAAIVMGVLLTRVHPLKCVALRTVHYASVIQTIMQTVQLFRKGYTEDMTAVQQSTHVYRTHHQPSVVSGRSRSME
jgi:hypothetical protein